MNAAAIEAIEAARKYAAGNASATLCLNDAIACRDRGLHTYAIRRALDSLAHSVGIFHEAHRRIKAQLAG